MSARIGSYKGNPTISLGEGKFPFTFGLAKARLVVENIDAIKAFANRQGAGPDRSDLNFEDRCAAAAGFSPLGRPE